MQKNGSSIVFTNKAKCRDCNRCVRYCPVKAIRIEGGQAQVIQEKCIACGTCVRECPQKAKSYKYDIDKVKFLLSNKEKIAISVAPSYAGIYDEWQRLRLPSALRMLGFSFVSETASGAYHCARLSKQVIENSRGKSKLFSACPAVVNYIEKYEHDLVKNLVPVDSPMIIHAKMLKQRLGNDIKVVFAGPCIAKKSEVLREGNENLLDAVLTFEELKKLFEWKNIDISKCESSSFDEEPGLNSRNFPLEGGLLQTANLETDILSEKIFAVSGFDEISEMLQLIKNNQDNYIVEPLFCSYGCINGPGIQDTKLKLEIKKNILDFTKEHKGVDIPSNLDIRKFAQIFSKDERFVTQNYTELQISETLKKFGKTQKSDELNCGGCGYNSCRDKAIAVLEGIAETEMCLPYMRRLAEAKSSIVIDTSPNGIVVLNENLEIESINIAFKKMFACSDGILKRKISYLIDPAPFEKLATETVDEIKKIIHYPNYNLVCYQICYALRMEKKYIGIFNDITDIQTSREKLNDIKNETITQAKELIQHQINMAQELALFLGENTAKGEMLLNKLIDAIK